MLNSKRSGALDAPERVAVFGGRAEVVPLHANADVTFFGSPGDRGAGDTRRLEAAIRAGSLSLVIVLARWGGHSATAGIRRSCRATGTRLIMWPGGLSSLAQALSVTDSVGLMPPRLRLGGLSAEGGSKVPGQHLVAVPR